MQTKHDCLLHCWNMFFHLRRIRQVRRCLDKTCRCILVQALVTSRLNICNSVLSDIFSSTLQPLSSILHTDARLVRDLSPRLPETPTLKQLLRLPICARIAFKCCSQDDCSSATLLTYL